MVIRFLVVAPLLFVGSQLRADTPIVNDTSTNYSFPILGGSVGCTGTCDLSPTYNHYSLGVPFSISKITFQWQNNGGNNCDGLGNYGAIISSAPDHSGILASSTNSIYLGCAGFGGGTKGTGELDFTGQSIPPSFYLDFATVDGFLQGGSQITVSNVVIWQATPAQCGGAPIFAPTGQVINGFPLALILDNSPVFTNSYLINYCPSTTQYTVQWKSLNSVATLDNLYKQYLLANGWTIVNDQTLPNGSRGLASTKPSFQVGAAFIPAGAGATVTLTYLAIGNLTMAKSALGPAGSTVNPQQSVSEPISTGNGNYYYTHTDLSVSGRGIPLVFARQYNSLDDYVGPLGANWTHTYNIFLVQDGAGNVTVTWSDGHTELYTASGTAFNSQIGVYNVLSKNSDGSFLIVTKDQKIFGFNSAGLLTAIQDRNANTVSLAYSAGGNLQSVTAAGGQQLVFFYDSNNRITQVSDASGRVVSFTYTSANDLGHVTDPAGGITSYTYDSSHRVASITLPNGDVLLGNIYDLGGRVVAQTNGRNFTTALAYDTPTAGQTTITDPRGYQTIHSYDSSLRIVKITDAAGGTTSFAYDATNNRTSVTNQSGKTTSFSYDSTGNAIGVVDPLGNKTIFTYDSQNDVLTITNPRGNTTTFSYDPAGNLISIRDALGNSTSFVRDAFGEMTSKTDARGNSTKYLYDSLGDITRVTDGLNHSATLGYDTIGRLTSVTDANNHSISSTYDALSRLVKFSDALGNKTVLAYDPVGNLAQTNDANGHTTKFTYDAANNLIGVTDALEHVTQYGYDENNNRKNFTNANGSVTSYSFDALNRLTTVTDPLTFVTAYTYDPVGNVASTIDAKGQTNQFVYDALNRLTGISYADGKTVSCSYDTDGNRTIMVDHHGTTAYTYDPLDRLMTVNSPGGKTVSYNYDAVGNRSSLTHSDGKLLAYAYDQANRLIKVTDWIGRDTTYQYDPVGNLLTTVYPSRASIKFSYDIANRLTKVVNVFDGLPLVNIGYELDAVGNRTGEIVDGLETKFGYDPLDELVSAQLGVLKTDWTYDAAGNRLTQKDPFSVTAYTYDAGDRLLSATGATFKYDNNGNQISKSTKAGVVTYSYDAANRLVAVGGPNVNSHFDCDGDGNRFFQGTIRGNYIYVNDVANSLPAVLDEQGPDGNIAYAYGVNRIEEFNSAFNYFYQYDGLGSVVALTDNVGRPDAAYAYDPWGSPILAISDTLKDRNKFRFTSEAFDSATQLYYLRARYYDPTVGRFLTRDPLRGQVFHPLTQNRYQYAIANPLRYTDPTGLFGIDDIKTLLDTVSSFVGISTKLNQAEQSAAVFNACTLNVEQCPNIGQVNANLNGSIVSLGGELVKTGSETVLQTQLPSSGTVIDLLDISNLPLQLRNLFTVPIAKASGK